MLGDRIFVLQVNLPVLRINLMLRLSCTAAPLGATRSLNHGSHELFDGWTRSGHGWSCLVMSATELHRGCPPIVQGSSLAHHSLTAMPAGDEGPGLRGVAALVTSPVRVSTTHDS